MTSAGDAAAAVLLVGNEDVILQCISKMLRESGGLPGDVRGCSIEASHETRRAASTKRSIFVKREAGFVGSDGLSRVGRKVGDCVDVFLKG